MENTVIIEPVDKEMAVMARAVKVRNDFLKKGFTTRAAFIGVVHDKLPQYREYSKTLLLERFWVSRHREEQTVIALEKVLESLKNE